ncbi:MAG: AAA family ATPase [Bacteroidetes bacterium]|nr:AAA family ATPase [Bacteroidota bacterium]
MIKRSLTKIIQDRMFDGKAIIILGARQTGKTTLVREFLNEPGGRSLYLNCDEPAVRNVLDGVSTAKWRQLIGHSKIVIIDEAQQIKDIGIKLKLVTDQIEDVQLVVTGSSSLELASGINEPLTGRKWEYFLYPVCWEELSGKYSFIERRQQVELRLIFGMYPEVIMKPGREQEILKNLASSYLYKDLLAFKGIRKPELLERLLRSLALQIGNEVSYNELAGLLQVDKNTIMTYTGLLEQAFIIFRLQPLNRNMRNEISTIRKIYFYDNGIRNALINNFNPLNSREDVGALWENFMISERIKFIHYHKQYMNHYFWRTHDRKEIDLVEESGGKFDLFEFKWGRSRKSSVFTHFRNHYPVRDEKIITPENMEEILI